MNKIEPEVYFQAQSSFNFIPYTQSYPWFEYLKIRNEELEFYANDITNPTIAFMGRVKKIAFIGKILFIESVSIDDTIDNETITSFFKDLKTLPYNAIELNSSNKYSVEFEIGIRRAGFFRPIATTSCPLSIKVNLLSPLSFNRNWRKNYRKAVKSELRFKEVMTPEASDLKRFSDMYNDMSARKKMGYTIKAENLSALFGSQAMRLFVVLNVHDEIIAGRITYVNNDQGYDVLAANSINSRNNGATHFLVQSLMEKLSSEGIQSFDLGRIPPGEGPMDGIYVFKKSIAGEKIQYNGEWTWYKSHLSEIIVNTAKILIGNKKRF